MRRTTWLLVVALGAPAAAEELRLPRDVAPASQSVRLVLDPAQPEYTGRVEIELEVRRAVPSFAFHARDMTLDRIALRGGAGEIPVTHDVGAHGTVTVSPKAALSPGRYTLAADFRNDFDRRAAALYRVESGGDWYAFTQFYAVDARAAFPCWDEPGFKIPYQLTLEVPKDHLALSNTPVEREANEGERRVVVFRRTPPLPSYLLAFASGPFDTVPIAGLSVPARVVTVKGSGALAAEAARVTPKILPILEAWFGRPYPFEKLDLVAVPELSYGAMENPGAITFVDGLLLMDPRAPTAARRRAMVSVIAHELSHMWFGDLVTMAWWDDLWLNEAFATWMVAKVAPAFPEMALDVTSALAVQSAFATDARATTRAVRRPVTSVDQILTATDELAYQKGAAVLRMIEAWIGPPAFQKGVRDYLTAHEWKNATAADLWTALSSASRRDLRRPMESFLDQPGVPLVAAELVDSGKKVRLTQTRLANRGATPPPPATWHIPVGITYSDGNRPTRKTVLLTQPSEEFRLEVANPPVLWIHPNAGENGYYRWRAPRLFLTNMAGAARSRLDVRERIGFIGNLGALLDSGHVGGGDHLRMLAAFSTDPEPEVTRALVQGLGRARRALVTPEVRVAFASYVRRVLGPALDRIGLLPRPGESEAAGALRPALLLWLGREGEEARVLEQASSLASAALQDPGSVDPAIAAVAVEVAARGGDRALFDAYRRRFEAATIPSEREIFLGGLASFGDGELREEALRYVLAGPLRAHEVLRVPSQMMAASGVDRPVFWTLKNHGEIAKKVPLVSLAFLPKMLLEGTCSTQTADEVRRFFAEPGRAAPGASEQLEKAAEAVRDCAAVRAAEAASAAAYLRTISLP